MSRAETDLARHAGARNAPRDGSNLGPVIQAYMRAHGLATHAEMAAVLGVDRTLVTKYVSGARHCHDVTQLRRFAEAMDLPPETFGLLPDPDNALGVSDPASDEANHWRLVRRTLNRHRSDDFDLWRSMLREYSEELLGNPEHDGSSGGPIDYNTEEPCRTLNEGRRQGKVRAWCLGVGLDPLAPAGEILTVVVIDADVFDSAFTAMVARNAEGDIVPSAPGAVGIAWTPRNIRKAQSDEPLACAAAACLALTWKHRGLILGG